MLKVTEPVKDLFRKAVDYHTYRLIKKAQDTMTTQATNFTARKKYEGPNEGQRIFKNIFHVGSRHFARL